MKITKSTNGDLKNIDFVSTEKKEVVAPQQSFQSKLSSASSENYQVRIAGLLSQIEDQAKKLSKKVDIKELKVYKKMVSELLNETINGSHKFSKESKLDRFGRHRVYGLIKKINDNMEDLTQEILKEEKDNLIVLQKLDDIKGLLLDICT